MQIFITTQKMKMKTKMKMKYKKGDRVYVHRTATEQEIKQLRAVDFYWTDSGVHKWGVVVETLLNDPNVITSQYIIEFDDMNICYPVEFVDDFRKEKLERLLNE